MTLRTKYTRIPAAAGGAALALAVALGPVAAGALPPVGGGPIKPNQLFAATVNGSMGLGGPVTIQTTCLGPVKPGEFGHPLKGQTVAVFMPAVISTMTGNTGAHGHEIGAFFGPPPPTATPGSGAVIFHKYTTKAIPTSEVVPCGVTGTVTFVPLPMSPGTERTVSIPVVYSSGP